jgi:hypothetical protein
MGITFPPAPPVVGSPSLSPGGHFQLIVSESTGLTYEIIASTNLQSWFSLTSVVSTSTQFEFLELRATNHPKRFYRAEKH